MSEWQKMRLGDAIELKRGFDLPQQSRIVGSVPIVSSSGISGFHNEMKLKAPGVITGRYGTIGEVFFIEKDFWPLNTTLYVSDFKGNDPRFISYLLRTVNFQAYSDKAAVPGINRNHLHEALVQVPSLADQRAIAHILGTLDDKIELNRRMNETLEAMARAIFKSWFVDFDPVRAKASGEPPESICRRLGLTPDVLALFPDSFQDSELGEIPKGWNPTRIDEVLELAYGKALKASDRLDGPVPVYGSGGITGFHSERLVDGPGVIVGRKGTVGSLYWEDKPFYPIDTVFFVIPKVQLSYCYYVLQTLGLETMNTDAAVPGLNRANVYRLQVALPENGIRTEFDRIQTSLHRYQSRGKLEIEALESLRATLLPKLLSGELPMNELAQI